MSSASPLVSVVVASYNMGAYVKDAVQSVLDQTVSDLDVHVVDDGSTDDTRAVIESFKGDPRVHYHYQANAGQTRAKNAGILASTGHHVGFCDADDLWLPRKLERQIPILESHPNVGVVYTRSQPIDASGKWLAPRLYPEHRGRVTEPLFFENFVPFGTALVRRSALSAKGAFNEKYRMGIDWELWLRLSVDYEFEHIPEVTYLYRIWEGQMSSNWRGRYEACFAIMREFEQSHPGLVTPQTVRRAYSHSYANRARARASLSKDYVGALGDVVSAVRSGYPTKPAVKLAGLIAAQSLGLR